MLLPTHRIRAEGAEATGSGGREATRSFGLECAAGGQWTGCVVGPQHADEASSPESRLVPRAVSHLGKGARLGAFGNMGAREPARAERGGVVRLWAGGRSD